MTESSTKLQSPGQSEIPSGIKEESMIDLGMTFNNIANTLYLMSFFDFS